MFWDSFCRYESTVSVPWGDQVTSSRMRRRKQRSFVVQTSWLMFEGPQGHYGQSSADDREMEHRILTVASRRGTVERYQSEKVMRTVWWVWQWASAATALHVTNFIWISSQHDHFTLCRFLSRKTCGSSVALLRSRTPAATTVSCSGFQRHNWTEFQLSPTSQDVSANN